MQIFEQGQPCSILDLCKEGKSGKAFQALVKASASDQEPPKTLFVVISPVADTVESVEKAAGLLSENWNEIKNFKGIEVQQMWSEDEGWTDPLVVAAFFKALASSKQVLESIVCLRLEIIGFDESKDTNALVDSLLPFKDNLQELYLFWNTGPNDEQVSKLLSPKLQFLDLPSFEMYRTGGICYLTDACIPQILKTCVKLEKLKITGQNLITKDARDKVAKYM